MKHKGATRLLSLLVAFLVIAPMVPASAERQISPRLQKVIEHAENILKYGRNIPGSKEPSLFVEALNVDTYEPAVWVNGGETHIPAQFMGQQNLMRLLFGLTELTGDPKYKQIAIDQYNYYFDHFVDKNGLIYMGCHAYIDVLTGKVVTDGDAYEVKQNNIPYRLMYEANPEATIKFIEAMWNGHLYDFEGLRLNRHNYFNSTKGKLWNSQYKDDDPYIKGEGTKIPFISTAMDLVQGASLIYEKTGDKMPIVWAGRIFEKWRGTANQETGLMGSQYGTYSDEEGGDRFYAQFGPELGDYALEPHYISGTYKQLGTYGDTIIPYVKLSGDEEMSKAFLRYYEAMIDFYIPEEHKFRTSFLTDGTSLGGMIIPRDGYYGSEGDKLPEYCKPWPSQFSGAVYAYNYYHSEKIWNFLRAWVKNEGMGDVGSAPGVDMDLNYKTSKSNKYYVLAFKYLYDEYGCEEYAKMADRICDNMVNEYFRNGLFARNAGGVMCELDSEEAWVTMVWEASRMGIDLPEQDHIFGNSNIDMAYDGIGRTYATTVYYDALKHTPATSVELDKEEVSLAVNSNKSSLFNDISGHWGERQIRQMSAAGIMDGRGDGNFYPDDHVTRAEFVKMVNTMCGFNNTTEPMINFTDISKSDWFYNEAVKARNANILDYHLTKDTVFGGNEILTREEMASILVRALKAIKPDGRYGEVGCLFNFTDTADISDWAKEYVDTAYNYRIINGTSQNTLSPKAPVTRAQAAAAIKGFENSVANEDIVALNAIILPDGCTNKTLSWTTSDINVVDVDDKGRLYPMGPGEATITVKCGEVTDTTKVVVRATEDWMIKKIKIDGVKYDEFEPDKLDYNLDLPIGTTKLPEITAESYDGTRVFVAKPSQIPGTVKMYLDKKGGSTTYSINLTANKIAYIINENFDGYDADTPLRDVRSGEVLWGMGTDYVSKALVVNKPLFVASDAGDEEEQEGDTKMVEAATDSNDKCVLLPYNVKYKYLGEFRGQFLTSTYQTGEASGGDDSFLVFDVDVMVDAPFKDLNIRVGTAQGGYNWAHKLVFTESTLVNEKTKEEVCTYEPGKFFNLKMVVDRKSLMGTFYIDGVKVLSDQVPMNALSTINVMMFHMPANLNAGANLYFDNIKIYEVKADGLEASFKNN